MSKPLPPLQSEAAGSSKSVMFPPQATLFTEHRSSSGLQPRPPSPGKTVRAREAPVPIRTLGHGKRRSMSVSEVDLKNATISLAPVPPPPTAHEKRSEDSMGLDSTIRGILSDFKGELSQFDKDTTPLTNTLDLRLPSTSSQRPARLRMRSDEPTTSVSKPDIRQDTSSPPPLMKPNPTIVAYAPDADEASIRQGSADPSEVILPGRSPPLTGTGTRAFSHPHRPFSGAGNRPLGPRSASSMHSSIEARDRLLARPRPTASEPSLLSGHTNAVSPPLSTLSQQDLSMNTNQTFRRLQSDNLAPTDSEELDTRGKECAKRAWEEDEEFLAKERIAEWLGGTYVLTFLIRCPLLIPLFSGRVNKIALRHYMDNFDFSGLRLDLAFRCDLGTCDRFHLIDSP
jgi:PH and SEC7 domain-containing protein